MATEVKKRKKRPKCEQCNVAFKPTDDITCSSLHGGRSVFVHEECYHGWASRWDSAYDFLDYESLLEEIKEREEMDREYN